jgi:hypothetical protein
VIYDGAEGIGHPGKTGRIETRFSKPPETADDVIRGLVEAKVDRVESVTVVTSDAEVARHARGVGAGIALADLFLASALGPGRDSEVPEKPASLSKKELEEWADIFKRRSSGGGEGGEETRH